MEELKFRVFDCQKKKMYYNAFPSFGDTVIYMDGGVRKVLSKDLGDDYIIMQFTGLKDKKNKEIYEGDIVKFDVREFGEYGEGMPEEIGEVDRVKCYNLGDLAFGNWNSSFCYNIIVTGNIYENPELLKKGGAK